MQGRAIYKQVLVDSRPVQRFEWPSGSEVLHAEVKDGHPCIWFVCNPGQPRLPRTFLLLPTGGPYGEGKAEDEGWSKDIGRGSHVATFLSEGRSIVGHLFEVGAVSEETEKQIEDDLAGAGKIARGGGWM